MNILALLYPVVHPKLNMAAVRDMLPLAHKYDIKGVLDECMEYLLTHFPANLSPDPMSECFIDDWLTSCSWMSCG